MDLPSAVIREDHRLEKASERSSEELAKHRWHWTLDEGNPKRVNVSAYARSVGKSQRTIQISARGYELYTVSRITGLTLIECMERAGVGEEKAIVVQTIAKERGQTFAYTRRQRPEEIREVAALAREQAAEKGTTFEKEVRKIAQNIVREEETSQRSTDRRSSRTATYIEIESYIVSARNSMRKSLRLAGSKMSDRDRDQLRSSINNLRDLVNLLDARLAGIKQLDWDAELDKILSAAEA